tara:strand:+ start:561 stop:788 length:228 start_codon:yes stop_codon:yes gene_type:complete
MKILYGSFDGKIICELCNERFDASLMRYYQYTRDMHEEDGSNPDGEIVRYFICEDCVIDHKKYGWKLGEDLTNAL